MEKWDLFDENRQYSGKIINKGEEVPNKFCRQVVHIIIINDKGEMLIQKRQPFRKLWPDLWDLTVGGSVIAGETIKDGAKRELFEELGLNIDFSNERPFFTINFEKGYDDFFIIKKNIDTSKLKLQYDEVKEVKWALKEAILKMINNKQFIPYYESFISFLFDTSKKRGLHK